MGTSQKILKQEKAAAVIVDNKQTSSPRLQKSRQKNPRDRILQDLEDMYQAAFAAKNFAIALRVLELRGKQLGLFKDKKAETIKSLEEMSEEELQALLGDQNL